MIDIFSSFGENKCVDLLKESLMQNVHMIDVTYGDTKIEDGKCKPREVGLTNPEEFGYRWRLDYIL